LVYEFRIGNLAGLRVLIRGAEILNGGRLHGEWDNRIGLSHCQGVLGEILLLRRGGAYAINRETDITELLGNSTSTLEPKSS
jgi:hypothetical protein